MPSGDGRRRPAFWRDERGQTLAFVMTTLLALTLVAGVSINIGQAVTRRVLLQMVADAGAFTGATVMARGMNTIAEQNLRIQKAWAVTADATLGFTAPPCIASDLATGAYAVVRTNVGRLIRALNEGYGQLAETEASRVTRYNAVDLFPSERLTMGESDSASGLVPQRPQGRLVNIEEVPGGTRPAVPSLSPGFTNRAWTCWQGPLVMPRSKAFGLWYRMTPSAPIQFLWVVTAPRTEARFFDRFFGPRAIPEMTAAAVAKPVGGEIALGRAKYVAKMTPLRQIRGQVFDAVLRRVRTIHH
jgi:Flp pilus assembly protein TadG